MDKQIRKINEEMSEICRKLREFERRLKKAESKKDHSGVFNP